MELGGDTVEEANGRQIVVRTEVKEHPEEVLSKSNSNKRIKMVQRTSVVILL